VIGILGGVMKYVDPRRNTRREGESLGFTDVEKRRLE